MRFVTAAMFMSAWSTMTPVSPPASRRPNRSFDVTAMPNPAYANTTNAARIESVPKRPSSSPMMASTKSVCAAGR